MVGFKLRRRLRLYCAGRHYKSRHVRMRPASSKSREGPSMWYPRCRLCSAELRHTFVDLGMSPPCESYLNAAQLDAAEKFYPLHVRICENCLLVQRPAYIAPEDVFSDYAYFSSYSDSWVAHARRFVDTAATPLGLSTGSFVIEVAS